MFCRHGGIYRPEVWLYRRERPVLSLGSLEHFCMWAIRNRGRIGDISGRGLVFMIVLTLYYGFTSGGVDNMAHIGGLLAGFLSGVLLYRKRKDKYRTGISC